ncbi:MAG: hypothetical protein IK032_01495, partial [Bacteroidales bacterium]|nr:hypothetical protein [Bacteroidales bacterium]
SNLANRSSLHPYDNQRWHRFVISAFQNDSRLDGNTLGKILRLQLGWNDDKAFNLVIRYEDEIGDNIDKLQMLYDLLNGGKDIQYTKMLSELLKKHIENYMDL